MKRGYFVAAALVSSALLTVVLVGAWTDWFGANPPPNSAPDYGLPTLAFGPFNEAHAGPNFYYNSTIEQVGAPLTWSDLVLHVESPSGVILSGASTVTATNSAKTCNVAIYSFSGAAWSAPATPCATGTIGGSAPVSGGALIEVLSVKNFTAAGNSLVISSQDTYPDFSTLQIP
jgi:hypothetical protein